MMYHMGLQYFINLTHEMKRDVMCNKILYERRMVNISSTLGTVYSYSDFGRVHSSSVFGTVFVH